MVTHPKIIQISASNNDDIFALSNEGEIFHGSMFYGSMHWQKVVDPIEHPEHPLKKVEIDPRSYETKET